MAEIQSVLFLGDDEQAAQEESILTIGILYDRQARETRIADKGAIFHDAFFPCPSS